MSRHILLVNWADSAKAYEAFSQLKNSAALNVLQATIIERQLDGKFVVKDEINATDGSNTLTGGLFGSLFGILGGPLGVLLGFGTGALIGSFADLDDSDAGQAVLAKISQALPIGSTGLFIDLNEESEAVANSFFSQSNATVLRWDYDTVVTEIEASVAAWEEAQRVANITLNEQKKQENKAKREQKWQDFKAKFKH